jgi:hypothetical protein
MHSDRNILRPRQAAPALRAGLPSIAVALCFLFLAGCDFPADPPLKAPVQPKPDFQIDSARCLLPLKPGNVWTYTVLPKGEAPRIGYAIAGEQTYSGNIYSEVKYSYYPASSWYAVLAFPSILQKTSHALSFYEKGGVDSSGTRLPRLVYTLPYPAAVGTVWRDSHSDYQVTVAAKDTVLRSYDSLNTYACYRYDVQRIHGSGSGRIISMYCIPGSAILKIVYDDLVFFTTEWSVE